MRIAACICLLMLLPRACAEFSPLVFSLRAELSQGYEWSCEYEDNGVLSPPMEDFIADAGGDGTFEYHFGVNRVGEAQVIFNYGETMGIGVPEQTMICTVHVDGEGETSVFRAEIYDDDKTIVFILPDNPTTARTWNYAGDDSGVVSFLGEEYEAEFADLEGAGGWVRYDFRVEKPGRTLLLFNYADMWDPYAAADQTYAADLIVDENMEISLSVENSWDGG